MHLFLARVDLDGFLVGEFGEITALFVGPPAGASCMAWTGASRTFDDLLDQGGWGVLSPIMAPSQGTDWVVDPLGLPAAWLFGCPSQHLFAD